MTLYWSGCDVCTTVSWLLAVVSGTLVPAAALALGIVYRHSCPMEPNVTLYLYVTSSLYVGSFVYSVTSACCLQRSQCACFARCNENRCFYSLLLIEIALNLAILTWLIAGSVWIYSKHGVIRQEEGSCHRRFYRLSFILITTQWALFVLQHVVTFVHTLFGRRCRCTSKPHKQSPNYVNVLEKDDGSFDL